MVSKAYKPLSAASSRENVTKRCSSPKTTEPAQSRSTTTENHTPSPTSSASANLYPINPSSDVTTNLPSETLPPEEPVPSDLSSSREELELYNSKSLLLEQDRSQGELELSNSQSLMLGLSSNSLDQGVERVDHGSGRVVDQSVGRGVESTSVGADTALTSSVALT